MTDQSSTDPTMEGEFAIDVYKKDGSICLDIEWVDLQATDRIVLKLTTDETRQLINNLSEHLMLDEAD